MTLRRPIPTIDDVRRISALNDPVVRNLQITQCYHDLAAAVAAQIPGGANWCAVATWASRQAGQSIRKEDLRRAFERLMRESADAVGALEDAAAESAAIRGEEGPESLAGALAAFRDALSPAAAFERTSEAVARGNRKVFEEIGYEFARFLALLEGGPLDDDALAGFYDGLKPGTPPVGQDYLRAAFTHYHDASRATGTKRAQYLLLANLEVGFHEQTRLQPEILEAMNAPIVDPAALRGQLFDELFPDVGSRARLALARLSGRADRLLAATDALAHETQRLGRLAITDLLMTLELPDGRVMRLGRDLAGEYPESLRTVTLPGLASLLAQVDPGPDTLAGSGSEDWSRLPDRMRFIAELFRAYQLDPALFDPPFTAEQLAEFSAGGRPATL